MSNYINLNKNEIDKSGIIASGDDNLKKHVDTMNRLYQEGGEKLEELGEYALENDFNDDPKLTSSRDPEKRASLRKLVEHPDLDISPSTLNRCIRVAVQSRFLKEQGIDPTKLSHAKKRMLISLRNGKAKAEIAKKIIAESLSRSQIETLIPKKQKKHKPQPEEKPISKFDQIIGSLQCIREVDINHAMDEISDNHEALAKLRKEAARVSEWAADLINKIDANCLTCDTAESGHEDG